MKTFDSLRGFASRGLLLFYFCMGCCPCQEGEAWLSGS